jgi:hypothetical protein
VAPSSFLFLHKTLLKEGGKGGREGGREEGKKRGGILTEVEREGGEGREGGREGEVALSLVNLCYLFLRVVVCMCG